MQRRRNNFNSIKVRLRRSMKSILLCCGILFQFHKGSIKTKKRQSWTFDQKYFNSIKVRLRRAKSPACTAPKAFQFHKGSIKTATRFSILRALQLFQFHKGSIKTARPALTISRPQFQFHKGSIKTD